MIKRWKIGVDRVPRQDRETRQFCPHCGCKYRLPKPEFQRHVRDCRAQRARYRY